MEKRAWTAAFRVGITASKAQGPLAQALCFGTLASVIDA